MNEPKATYRHAMIMSRYWYRRYADLPRWFRKSRKRALMFSKLWGIVAKYAFDEDRAER